MQIHSVGIDLGKTTFHLVALGESGKVLVRKKFSQKHLVSFTANLQTSLIGLPFTANTTLFSPFGNFTLWLTMFQVQEHAREDRFATSRGISYRCRPWHSPRRLSDVATFRPRGLQMSSAPQSFGKMRRVQAIDKRQHHSIVLFAGAKERASKLLEMATICADCNVLRCCSEAWLTIDNHRRRKGLVTDVSGPQRNVCPGTLTA